MRLAWLLIYLLSLPITAIGLETVIFEYANEGGGFSDKHMSMLTKSTWSYDVKPTTITQMRKKKHLQAKSACFREKGHVPLHTLYVRMSEN